MTAEKAALTTLQTITQVYGYGAGSDVPIFSKAYSTAGTISVASNPVAPGDAAILARYSTADRTSKNHAIYLYSWYHGLLLSSIATPDTVQAAMITLHTTYATSWVTGFSDGTITHHRSGPNGHLATGVLVANTVRHRDFPSG